MKKLIRSPFGVAVAAAIIATTALPIIPSARADDSAVVDFGKFTPPDKGGQFVEVNVGANLIAIAAKIAKSDEPDVADVLKGLKQVHVNVISLDDKNRSDVTDRIKKIRSDLDGRAWDRVVTAMSENDDVVVQLKVRDDKTVDGVAVTVLTGDNQAVLVNVVGEIQPEKLVMLGQKFDIEPLKKLKLKEKKG